MARFYGHITGSRNSTITKCGDKKTGINAHIRGWNIGVKIDMYVDKEDNDIISVKLSKGSNNSTCVKDLGRYRIDKKGKLVKVKS